MGKIIRFYRAENGRIPVKEFLDSLSGKVAQKLTWVLKAAEDFDALPTTYFKKLFGSDDIWEFRVQLGSNHYRILCFHAGGSSPVLTHGFMKKTRRTPGKEIEKAETCRLDYLRRYRGHE